MPLLKREVEMSHPDLFDLSKTGFPWWVAHTRSRQEKALARFLLPLEIPFYVPQVRKETRRRGRSLVSFLPLFPGYVFFRGSARDRLAAFRSGLLVAILEVENQDLLHTELAQLRRLQESGADLLLQQEFQAGDLVRIKEGPFSGYSGVVIRDQGRLRLLVSITMLRKTVAVEFDRSVLASARPPRVGRETRIAVA
jgi:transcription antitermination factor NusG